MKNAVIFGLVLLLAAGATSAAPAPDAGESAELDRLLAQGLAQLDDRRPEAASRSFLEAVLVSGGSSYAAQLGLASALLKNGEPAAALEAAKEADRLAAGTAERAATANVSGLALYHLGRLEPAAEALERAIALDPRAAVPARITLARVREAEGELDEAIAYLRQTVAELPDGSRVGLETRLLLCELRGRHPEVEVEAIYPVAQSSSPRRNMITRPVAIHAPEPVYSAEVKRRRQRGGVRAEALIDRDGCVRGIAPLSGSYDALTEETMAAMRGWVFKPATLDGEPVGTTFVLRAALPSASPFSAFTFVR